MKLTVVGLGLIGGSAALDLRASSFASELIGVDSNPDHTVEALRLGLVDRVEELEPAVALADLVVLAVPVGAIETLLPRVLSVAGEGTTVTDMGSTKERICQAVSSHPRRMQFVGSHPMAGTEFSGPAAAIPSLFSGKVAVICDAAESAASHLERVERMYECLGMRLIRMGSKEHDLHAAYVSHLSHISSFVLANTVLDLEKNVNTIFDLASGGFESTVRLAKSSPAMWTPIFEQNQENVLNALDSYITHLQGFRESLSKRRFTETHQLMEEANEIRRVLARINSPVRKKV